MSRLVRLYPAAWRDRYGDEFEALLAERPPTAVDVLDTVRGAIDAHVHPQLHGEPAQPWTHRLPGLAALSGGLLWSAAALYIALSSNANWNAWSLLQISLVLMFLSLPGDYMAAQGRRIAVSLVVFAASVIGANVTPWPVLGFFMAVAYLTAIGGMLALAGIRAGVSAGVRWFLLFAAILVPVAISLPAASGLVTITDSPIWFVGIILPFGLAWSFLGLRMAVRGAQTIVDPPISPIQPEVNAA